MTKEQAQVREFHRVFGVTDNVRPVIPSSGDGQLRTALINEEAREFTFAAVMGDMIGVADALADLLYVVLGTAVTYGIDISPVFAEVHRSNMTKLWTADELSTAPPDSSIIRVAHDQARAFVVKRPDGKVLKSPSYQPASIAPIIAAQQEAHGHQ